MSFLTRLKDPFIWLKDVFEGWVSLMSSILGLVISFVGWFSSFDSNKLKSLVIGFGLLAFVISVSRSLIKKHAMLKTLLQSKPNLELGINLELDKNSDIYCLLVTNSNLVPARVTAKIEHVFLDDGTPHRHSSSLPIKLQWLHNPGNDSAIIGSEKVEVIRCKPYRLLNQKDGSRFIVKDDGDIDFFGKADSYNTTFYLSIIGATYDSFGGYFEGYKSIYYELVLYGGEDAPSKPVWRLNTVWCHFKIDGNELDTEILFSKPDSLGVTQLTA